MAPTEASPARRGWRTVRGPLLLTLAILVVVVVSALVNTAGGRDALDPASPADRGSRALAALLRDRGVEVERVTTVAAALASANAASTVFVPVPGRVPSDELSRLVAAGGQPAFVLVDPPPALLNALASGVTSSDSADVRPRLPGCDLPAAVVAGSAEMGGTTYSVTSDGATTCYSARGRPTLVAVDGRAGPVTVVGSADPFTNARLGVAGNAALTLSLLGTRDRVVWLLPRPGQLAPPGTERPRLVDLLPDRLLVAAAQLGVAVLLLALWRGRRLGPVVTEALPVVVRAAETVEGRARLYAAARARRQAAGDLRAGTRTRLAHRLGLPAEPAASALVDAVTRRTARNPAEVSALLYGAPDAPDVPDDAALVRLATDLDTLEAEVRRT